MRPKWIFRFAGALIIIVAIFYIFMNNNSVNIVKTSFTPTSLTSYTNSAGGTGGTVHEIQTGEGLINTIITNAGKLEVDTDYMQRRLNGTCAFGISDAPKNGTVTCALSESYANLTGAITISASNVSSGTFNGSYNLTGTLNVSDILLSGTNLTLRISSDNTTQNDLITSNNNTSNNRQSSDNTTIRNHQSSDNTTISNTYARLSGTTFTGDVTVNASLYVIGNISNVNVTNLNVNGSMIPAFNNLFDIGTSTLAFANGYFTTDITINNIAILTRINSNNQTLLDNLSNTGNRIGTLENRHSSDNTTQDDKINSNNNTILALSGTKINLTSSSSMQCSTDEYIGNISLLGGTITSSKCFNDTGGGYDDTVINQTIGQKANQTEFTNTNTTLSARINSDNTTQDNKINANNNTLYTQIGTKINLTASSSIQCTSGEYVGNVSLLGGVIIASKCFNDTGGGGYDDTVINQTIGQKANQTEFANTNTTIFSRINGNNQTLLDMITGNNNTLYAIAGEKLNLTGGILSGLFQVGNVSTLNNVSVNLSYVLYVNSSQAFVGIGTTNPETILDVAGGDILLDNGRFIRAESSTGTNIQIFGIDTNNDVTIGRGNLDSVDNNDGRVIIVTGTGKEFRILNAANTNLNMFIRNNDGNVGLSTTTPAAKLDITTTGEAMALSNWPMLKWANNIIDFGGYNASMWQGIKFHSAGAERMRIDSAGRVGIGITLPYTTLHVAGNGTFNGTLFVNAINVTGRQESDNTTTYATLGTKVNLSDYVKKVKTSAESRTNNATNDDDDLQFSIGANEIWSMRAVFTATSTSATPDIKIEWVEPDGTFDIMGAWYVNNNAAATTNRHMNEATGTIGNIPISANDVTSFHFIGTIRAGASGGTFKLQWSQQTTNAAATTVEAGSYLVAEKLK